MAGLGPHQGVAAAALSVAATAVVVAASSLYHHQQQRLEADPKAPCPTFEDDEGDDDADGAAADAVYVGLVRLRVATNDRQRVTNDVVLAMAIREVAETLYVFIDSTDTHAAAQYTGELLETSWHLAVAADKRDLQIEVVAATTAPSAWDNILALPDLGAVYGEYETIREPESKWLPRGGLLPVAYRSPTLELTKYFRPGMSYFDDQGDRVEHGAARQSIVLVQGTFDHLHNGHKRLLSLAAGVCGERLLVGVTAAPHLLAALPFADLIEPLETRKRHLATFVASVNASVTVEFIDIHDHWGPAGTIDDTRIMHVVSSSDIDHWDEAREHRYSLGLAGLIVRVVHRPNRAMLSSRCIRELIAKKRP